MTTPNQTAPDATAATLDGIIVTFQTTGLKVPEDKIVSKIIQSSLAGMKRSLEFRVNDLMDEILGDNLDDLPPSQATAISMKLEAFLSAELVKLVELKRKTWTKTNSAPTANLTPQS